MARKHTEQWIDVRGNGRIEDAADKDTHTHNRMSLLKRNQSIALPSCFSISNQFRPLCELLCVILRDTYTRAWLIHEYPYSTADMYVIGNMLVYLSRSCGLNRTKWEVCSIYFIRISTLICWDTLQFYTDATASVIATHKAGFSISLDVRNSPYDFAAFSDYGECMTCLTNFPVSPHFP